MFFPVSHEAVVTTTAHDNDSSPNQPVVPPPHISHQTKTQPTFINELDYPLEYYGQNYLQFACQDEVLKFAEALVILKNIKKIALGGN